MKILSFIFAVVITIAKVQCNSTQDAVNLCYEQIKVEDDSDVCYAQNSKCTIADLNEWVFIHNVTRRLRDLSWENRLFTCFHACMMSQRGEMARGKINLEKYIENLAVDYNLLIDEDSKLQISECGLKANGLDDECSVAALMGECITDKWALIERGLHTK